MKKECNYIGRYISQIHRKGRAYISKELHDFGIGYGQVMFLLELYRGDGKSQEDLAEALHIDKGTTARAIKKLEEKEFVTRIKDEFDKRANRVYLTIKGKDLKDDIIAVMMRWENKIVVNLNKEESEILLNLIERVCTKM